MRTQDETKTANIFSVNLTGGQEYTFEFSRNLTESLGGVLLVVKIYAPVNASLTEDVAEPMDFVKVAAYPEERPSILCYTVKPEKSGTYIVTVYDGETSFTSTAEDSELDSWCAVINSAELGTVFRDNDQAYRTHEGRNYRKRVVGGDNMFKFIIKIIIKIMKRGDNNGDD